ncbi:hypothetical protein BGZ94_000217 [Podila epigama]|nr:hypothetical protein BGZ94_000217 [Podila epigama]
MSTSGKSTASRAPSASGHSEYRSTAKPKPPLTAEERQRMKKPRVLIVGGGIGGLTLAILLKKLGIPFAIFERAREVKPLGAALSLGAGVAPLFTQMGIYDEFIRIAKHYNQLHVWDEDLNPQFSMDGTWIEGVTSYREYIISRPDLYGLLWRHVPRECIYLGKRILSFEQNEEGVMIRSADGSTYHGDILVGADGAYSAVRQHLHKSLKLKNQLPSGEDISLPFSCVCLVGQTGVLDPEEFPHLKEDASQVNSVLGVTNMCTWSTHTTNRNTVCWSVIQYLNKETSKDHDSFRNSEWGPEAAEAMCKEVRHFKVPGGKDGNELTLGDYIDRSNKHFISKVMLEEMVFKTWYKDRTVLLGDSCHKMDPSGGLGALNAMYDAVTLANWISTLKNHSLKSLEEIFRQYRIERYPVAKEAFANSKMFSKSFGKSISSVCMRGMMKRLPAWLWRSIVTKNQLAVRPQASFLPQVEERGKVKAAYQRSLHKTLAIHKKQEEHASRNRGRSASF